MPRALLWLLVAWMLSVSTAAFATGDDIEARAKALETRLISPCCPHQTLDIHRSPAADAMKADIRVRLNAGETEEEILAEYEKQYGPDIIAQEDTGQVNLLAISLLGVGGVAAVGVFVMLRRFRRRSDESDAAQAKALKKRSKKNKKSAEEDAELDERLDAELRAMDD